MSSNNNSRLRLEIYCYLLSKRNGFCAPSSLDIENPPRHTCCEDQFTAVLLDPISDSLLDYLRRVIEQDDLVALTISHIRSHLLRLHQDLLHRLATQQQMVPAPMEIIDLTKDDSKVNYTPY